MSESFWLELILVAVGIFATYYWVRRNEMRVRATELVGLVEATRDLANRYWLSNSKATDSIANEALLKFKLQQISSNLSNLHDSYRCFRSEADHTFIEFRRAITGGEFESSNRSNSTSRVDQINALAVTLELEIRNSQKLL